jgi:hypothetical protein
MHFSAYFKFQLGSVRIGSLIFRFGRFGSRVSEEVIGSVRFGSRRIGSVYFSKNSNCAHLWSSSLCFLFCELPFFESRHRHSMYCCIYPAWCFLIKKLKAFCVCTLRIHCQNTICLSMYVLLFLSIRC